MTRILFAAAAAMLLAAPAFAEGGDVFTNNPNELPQFLQNDAPNPTDWAGSFFHSQIRPEAARSNSLTQRALPHTTRRADAPLS